MARPRSFRLLLSACIFTVVAICATANRPVPENKSPWQKVLDAMADDKKAANNPMPQDRGNYTRVCDPARYKNLGLDMNVFQFCNKNLPYDLRAKDLVDRMTVEEKVQQIGDIALGVARLGIPRYEWWNEALHGVSDVGQNGHGGTYFNADVPGATLFPTVIVTAATFNQTLWKTIGEVISTEARAMRNLGHAGVNFWTPNVNIARDPRWGRILETPGEDPLVVGRYAVSLVRGLQDIPGTDLTKNLNFRPLKVSACCKHVAAYDLDKWEGTDRFHFDARVTEQDMEETFLRPFEMCVKEGDVSSIMCSYNRLNGFPTCADPGLLRGTVREKWGLRGYIVSDCGSIQVFQQQHHFLNDTAEDAVGQSLRAGLDMDCGNYYTNFVHNALTQGKASEMDVDSALRNSYTVLFRLGYFDGSPMYDSLGKKDICSPQHIELATETARQGIVLLKNTNAALPLDPKTIKNIALVGPHGNASFVMIGNYAGMPCRFSTPLAALGAYGKVNYQLGCADVACANGNLIPPAVEAAKKADATIVVVGLDLSVEAEGLDRDNLLFPGFQTQLINQVADASKGPVILVLMSAGPLDVTFAKKNPKIKAIVWAGYPGEEGGTAIADIVFGKANPGGKLPITWYDNEYTKKIPMTSMQFRPVHASGYPGRTYKFYNGTVVYPFGFGLSYTTFNYTLKAADKSIECPLKKLQRCRDVAYHPGIRKPECPSLGVAEMDCVQNFTFSVDVHNTGKVAGSEVVIVYAKPPHGIAEAPLKQVIGFKRVFLPPGRKQTVPFKFNLCESLKIVNRGARKILPMGLHTILVGDTLSYQFSVNLQGKVPLSDDKSMPQAPKVKKPMNIEL